MIKDVENLGKHLLAMFVSSFISYSVDWMSYLLGA